VSGDTTRYCQGHGPNTTSEREGVQSLPVRAQTKADGDRQGSAWSGVQTLPAVRAQAVGNTVNSYAGDVDRFLRFLSSRKKRLAEESQPGADRRVPVHAVQEGL